MQGHTDTKQSKTRNFLHNAYKVLQLEPGAEDGEIRRAYLRMMSRYHPDKLVRDNLSEESLKQAQEKSMAIRTAYETICGYRKIRAWSDLSYSWTSLVLWLRRRMTAEPLSETGA